MQDLLISLAVLAALGAAVPLWDRLALAQARRLNRQWAASAWSWAGAAGLDAGEVEALKARPEIAVPPAPAAVVWGLGLAVAVLSAAWVWRHPGDPAGAGLTLVLGAGLLVSILVDLRIQLLPDRLTWPLAALGAAVSAAGLGVSPQAALWGAVAGGGALWLIATGFKLLRGVEGLGLGDVKLVAMAGLWLGWMPLPWMLLGASMAAILLHLALHGGRPGHRVAFGPALALAFLATRAFWPFALG